MVMMDILKKPKAEESFAKFDPKNIPNRLNCGPMKLG